MPLRRVRKQEPEVKTEVRVVVRLEQSMLDKLSKTVAAHTIVNQQTTELMAGYQLGMQKVLNALQEGFTISDTPRYS
jgi:hypothetical protein